MNKALVLIFGLSLFLAVNSQATHDGPGFNYTGSYAFLRLQNYTLTQQQEIPDNWNSFVVFISNSVSTDFNADNVVAAKYLQGKNNLNLSSNVSNLSNDLAVIRLNLRDNKIFNLTSDFNGNLTNPLTIWISDATNQEQSFRIQSVSPSIENCTYFLLNANVNDQVFQSSCNMTVLGTPYNFQFNYTFTLSYPRLASFQDKDAKFQLRVMFDNTQLQQYVFQNGQQKIDQLYQFQQVLYDYQGLKTYNFLDPKNITQQDKQCNISATFNLKDQTYVDPCVNVEYQGAQGLLKFSRVFYCANNLNVNNLKSGSQVVYNVQGNYFEAQQVQKTPLLQISQQVSSPQQIILGSGLHQCGPSLFGSLLSLNNIMIVVMAFIFALFA